MKKNWYFREIVVSLFLACLLFVGICYLSFESYKESMRRVLNIETNIIFETMPYKISQLMINQEYDKVQEVIDSNKGVFLIVITDCKTLDNVCDNQKIVVTQQIVTNQRDNIKEYFNDIDKLKSEKNWVTLRNPANIGRGELYLHHYRDNEFEKRFNRDNGDIIGRLYVLPTPEFSSRTLLSTITRTLNYIYKYKKVSNDSYNYIKNAFISMILFIILLGLLIHYKRSNLEKKELNLSVKSLENEKKKLINDIESLKDDKKDIEKEYVSLNREHEFILNYALSNRHIVENEFVAPLNNEVQKLNAIIQGLTRRTELNTRDALHDINKAEILKPNLYSQGYELQENIQQSIDTISWTMSQVRGLMSTKIEKIDVQQAIQEFLDNRPPSAKADWISINFIQYSGILEIEANKYHIQSIVKNVMYNSKPAFSLKRRKLKRVGLNDTFNARIDIECGRLEDRVFIRITDNAGGVLPELLDKLYSSPLKVKPNAGDTQGFGSIIVYSYLNMYQAEVTKCNTEDGLEVTFLFKTKLEI